MRQSRRAVAPLFVHRSLSTIVAVVLMLLVVNVWSASAQSSLSTIQGSVKDESGAAVPGVTITLTSPALQVPQIVAVSEADGNYRIGELPAGTYKITFELTGFKTVVLSEFRLGIGFVARADASMIVGGLEETVTVTGASPVVDLSTTTTSVNLTRETLDSLPSGRGLQQLFAMTPGVTTNQVDVGDSAMWGTPLQALVAIANPEQADVHVVVPIDKMRIAKALLAHGANVNAKKQSSEVRWKGERFRRVLDGATPFILAAKAADFELMKLFLLNGADINITTQFHITPLMAAAGISWASSQDHATEAQVLEVVKFLVDEMHVDINATNDFGETAMHAAAYRGANSVVQYLFDKGADLNVTAKDGRTPLIVADGVEYGNSFQAQPQTAVLLRKLGAREQKCPGLCEALVFPPDPNAQPRERR